jgi:hypothetical protein
MARARKDTGANVGFEAELWMAADVDTSGEVPGLSCCFFGKWASRTPATAGQLAARATPLERSRPNRTGCRQCTRSPGRHGRTPVLRP